jgi:hypothetical protein
MDINKRAKLIPILEWLKKQDEFTSKPITDENSIFYNVAMVKYADLIRRYESDKNNLDRWIELPKTTSDKDGWDAYTRAAIENCWLKFDNNSVCRYESEDWPFATATHYKYATE